MEHTKVDKPVFKTESSIVNHPYRFPPKVLQFHAPTWFLLLVLIAAFFILKTFIYLKDDKRHGK